MIYSISLHEVLLALSAALDYVGIDDLCHGKRVARMAGECARQAGWSRERQDELILLGLLHDCGVSSSQVHRHLVSEWEWSQAHVHAERGADLLAPTRLLAHFAEPVRYHHTPWHMLKRSGLPHNVCEQANLIFLVDRVDALRACSEGREESSLWREKIASHSGSLFAPDLVEIFLAASDNDSFWFSLDSEPLELFFTEWAHRSPATDMEFSALLELAQMFASIVDGKSRFTYRHSLGVCAVARLLAEVSHLDEAERETVVLASLLHDLGKLRVDDAILDKPGAFDATERKVMNHHSFDTELILRRIGGFGEIAHIASLHHETLDGTGYPRRIKAEAIPRAARIIAVADIFQALVQNRPYRQPLSLDAACEVMAQMVVRGKLDPQVVGVLFAHGKEAFALARQHEEADASDFLDK